MFNTEFFFHPSQYNIKVGRDKFFFSSNQQNIIVYIYTLLVENVIGLNLTCLV